MADQPSTPRCESGMRVAPRPAMRVIWGMLLLSGCVVPMRTIERFPSQRMALSTLPVAPLAVSGSPGLSLAARVLVGAPVAQAQGGAVAYPSFQPELGGLVRLGERTFVGGRLNLGSGSFGVSPRSGGAQIPESAMAFDVGIGAGHDLQVQQGWGFTFSAELGLTGTSLTSTSKLGTFTDLRVEPAVRTALGVYGTPGPVRLFVAGSLMTGPWNDATSTITRDCFTTCQVTDSGILTTVAVGMLGGGARWQVNPFFSLAVELWIPFTAEATYLPPMLSLTLRGGDFVARPVQPAVSLPPPPPEVEPEEEVSPPQL